MNVTLLGNYYVINYNFFLILFYNSNKIEQNRNLFVKIGECQIIFIKNLLNEF